MAANKQLSHGEIFPRMTILTSVCRTPKSKAISLQKSRSSTGPSKKIKYPQGQRLHVHEWENNEGTGCGQAWPLPSWAILLYPHLFTSLLCLGLLPLNLIALVELRSNLNSYLHQSVNRKRNCELWFSVLFQNCSPPVWLAGSEGFCSVHVGQSSKYWIDINSLLAQLISFLFQWWKKLIEQKINK